MVAAKYVDQIISKPNGRTLTFPPLVCKFCRRALLIERKVLTEGWKSFQEISFQAFEFPVEVKDLTVIIKYSKEHQVCIS